MRYLIVAFLEKYCTLAHRTPIWGRYARCRAAMLSMNLDEKWQLGYWEDYDPR